MRAMVKDLLSLSDRYASLGPRFVRAFEFAKTIDVTAMPDGMHQIDGDAVRALVQRYDTKMAGEARWEAHRKHIDLQYVISGEE
jgi:YhcH/YjgK/YiaL family protein